MKLNLFSILMAFSLAFISCGKDDTSGPVITITSPAEGSALERGKTYPVSGNVTDDTEIAEIKIGNLTISSFDSPTKHTIANIELEIKSDEVVGNRIFTVIAKDKAGNESTKIVNFTVK
jgi:hypothetical protein